MKNFKRGLRCTVNVVLLLTIALVVSAMLTGCGKGEVEGEETVRVVTDRIKCDYYQCSSDRMSCIRVNNSMTWDCTLVLVRD